jgi:hypothetical protein
MTDEERHDVADLAMRALDTILEDYGEDARLSAASLVFEVEVPDEDERSMYHVNYKSLERSSPTHVGGLMQSMALHLLGPDCDD